jgi:nickel transport protein
VTQRLGKLVLSLGHDDQEDAYPSVKLVGITAVRADGSALAPLPVRRGAPPFWSVRAPAGLAMLGVSYRGGLSGQRPDGQWVDGPRGTDPAVLKVGRYDKYLLAILDRAAEPARAPTTRMQLVPDRNPLALRRGDRLRVQLLWDGKPLPGVAIMADYADNADLKHGVTDADGRLELAVQNQGLNVIGAMWIEPVAGDAEIDFVEHLATLTFALRPLSHQPGYMHPAMRPAVTSASAKLQGLPPSEQAMPMLDSTD